MMLEEQTIKKNLWKKPIPSGWLRGIVFLILLVSGIVVFKQSYPKPAVVFGKLWGLRSELLQDVRNQQYVEAKKNIVQWKKFLSQYRISSFFHEFKMETEQEVTSYNLETYLDDLEYVLNSNDADVINPVAAGFFDLHRKFASQFNTIPIGLNRGDDIESIKAFYLVEDPQKVPSLELEFSKDPRHGWNIHLVTRNFRFAPEKVMQNHVDGEGHAILYVDGKFVSRIYSEWVNLGQLTPGNHYVRVVLNTNDDREYKHHENVIEASETIKNENDMEKIFFNTSSSRPTESLRKSQIQKGQN